MPHLLPTHKKKSRKISDHDMIKYGITALSALIFVAVLVYIFFYETQIPELDAIAPFEKPCNTTALTPGLEKHEATLYTYCGRLDFTTADNLNNIRIIGPFNPGNVMSEMLVKARHNAGCMISSTTTNTTAAAQSLFQQTKDFMALSTPNPDAPKILANPMTCIIHMFDMLGRALPEYCDNMPKDHLKVSMLCPGTLFNNVAAMANDSTIAINKATSTCCQALNS